MTAVNYKELNLTQTQIDTIDAIYDTYIPPIEDEEEVQRIVAKFRNKDDDDETNLEKEKHIRTFLQLKGSRSTPLLLKLMGNSNMMTSTDLNDLLFAINLLSTSWGTFVLCGHTRPFYQLSLSERDQVIKNFSTSYLVPKRMLANSLRTLMLLLWCSDVPSPPPNSEYPFRLNPMDPTRVSPIWAAIGYPGPDPNMQSNSPKWQLTLKKQLWYLPQFDILSKFHYSNLLSSRPHLSPSPMPQRGQVQYDAVIIGSGSGSGPVALQLSQAGYRVLVIEQGSYNPPELINGLEAEAFEKKYLNGACLTTTDKSITVLAASTWGGGSAVNWSASLSTPNYVRENWRDDFGLDFCTTEAFSTCLQRVKDIMQVHPHPVGHHNKANSVLLHGADRLGYPARVLDQNGIDEHNCGWCFTGCKYQHKQGTNHSFHPISINKYGLEVITEAHVEEILFEPFPHWTHQHQNAIKTLNNEFPIPEFSILPELNLSDRFNPDCNSAPQLIPSYQVHNIFLPNRPFNTTKRVATGVMVNYRHPTSRQMTKIRVNAKIVVVSAGALQTPLLLHRSKITHPHLGHNLRLHPVIGCAALYPDVQNCWEGTQMTSICTVAQNQENNYGAIIETPNAHLGLMAGALPWWGGKAFKELALSINRLIPFICLTREMTSSGSVSDFEGKVQINYNFTQKDRGFLLEGLIAALKIHAEAGATELICPFYGVANFKIDPVLKSSDPAFHCWLDSLRSHHIVNHSCQLLSAHQMGTARMSKNPSHGPTDVNGELHGCTNVFIADTSLFPTASGVNPMLTVMALAQYVGLNIQNRLERIKFIEEGLQKKGLYLYDDCPKTTD